ncbi:MAG: metallophosphoesterase [Clostridia bacterium]|nr:metallophosphoesterase [Clostridia bacterium]
MADISKIKIGDDEYSIKDEKRHEHENKDILDLIGLGKHGNLTVKTEAESESILWNVHNGSVIEGYQIDEETGDITLFVRLVPNPAIPAEKIKIKQSFDVPESGNVDLSAIAETVTVNERVTLFDSDTDDLIVGLVTDTGYNSNHTNYMTLDFIDVSGINTVTFKVTAYTPADALNPGRDFYQAFLDADLKTIEGTREPCKMYGIKNSEGTNLTGHTTSGLHNLNIGDVNYAYGMTATLDVPEGAKYLALTNLKAGDTIDIEVYTEHSGEAVRIKQNAMPAEFKKLQKVADVTAKQCAQNTSDIAELKANTVKEIPLSDYVHEHINTVALAAKAHMKADSACVVVFTDTHYIKTDTCYPTEIARQLAESVNASAIFHLGDLAHMATEGKDVGIKLWHKHSRILHNTKIPYFQVVGNHDDGNIYLHSVTNDYSAENYLSVPDLYFATTKQSRNHITVGSVSGGYYYFDDEDSKIRFIVLNTHEYPWIVDESGVLTYDSNRADFEAESADPDNATLPHGISAVYSDKQLLWLANTALNFSDKEEESEWNVIVFGHGGTTQWANVNVLFQDFKTGTKCTRFGGYPSPQNIYDYSQLQASLTNDFSTVGARKIAYLLGDVHCDSIDSTQVYPIMYFLNASPAQDSPTLAPPKTKGTPTETAISVLVITPSENKITELRFGAGTNEEGTYDPLTDYDNYRVVEY